MYVVCLSPWTSEKAVRVRDVNEVALNDFITNLDTFVFYLAIFTTSWPCFKLLTRMSSTLNQHDPTPPISGPSS